MALMRAFSAVETCYTQTAKQRGMIGSGRASFVGARDWLKSRGHITEDDVQICEYLREARNLSAHKFGYEPSAAQARKSLRYARLLCHRFSRRVEDVMVSPVIVAKHDERIGNYFQLMIDGISHIPVMKGRRMVGTLRDFDLIASLTKGQPLRPETPVHALMDSSLLPRIARAAAIDEAISSFSVHRVAALLVGRRTYPEGIITPYDLMLA